ncbi:MAG: ribosome-binding factor A [Halobacteriovorax sp.]|nr:ribosome-binding factor A [Halobacteriovorax sp.]
MAKVKSFKKEKFEERLLHEMNGMLRREISDPRASFLSFTKVELSHDYSVANVYWDTFDSDRKEDCSEAVKGLAGKFRSLLANVLQIRHTPQLKFAYDNQFEAQAEIDRLLKNQTNSSEGDS